MNGQNAECPSNIPQNPPPNPEPGTDWSTNRLTVDCEGQFELCYTLRAGDEANPQPTDCELVSVCVQVWYDTVDQVMELPPLPAWTSSNTTCAAQFANTGGYGEMSVIGLSVECDPIDDGNNGFYIFHRIDRSSCSDPPQEGELEPSGFYRADYLDGPLLVLFMGKSDITFSLQDFKICGDCIIRGEAEIGAYLFKTGGSFPLSHIMRDISQECLLLFRQFHVLLPLRQQNLQFYRLKYCIFY